MFEQVLAADARGLSACEALRGRTDPVEMEICFKEITESVAVETREVQRLRKSENAKAQIGTDAISSDVEWKLRIISEFSFDFPLGWTDALVACWAEKPWLRDLPG